MDLRIPSSSEAARMPAPGRFASWDTWGKPQNKGSVQQMKRSIPYVRTHLCVSLWPYSRSEPSSVTKGGSTLSSASRR